MVRRLRSYEKKDEELPKFEDIRPETDLRNPIFKVGLRFPTIPICKKAVRNYSIINKKKIRFAKNDVNKVRAVCKRVEKGHCPWVWDY